MKRSESGEPRASTFESGAVDVEDVLATSPVVLYTASMDGERMTPLWVSRNVELILGYGVHEALAPGWWWDRVHPDDRDRAAGSGRALLRRKQYSHEYRFRHANGAYVWVLDQMKTVVRDSGDVTVVGSWTDVSAARHQQARLEAAEAHYRRLIQTSPYAIYALDLEGRFTEVSGATAELLGRPVDELIGRPFASIIAPEDLPAAVDAFARRVRGEVETSDLEMHVVRSDGERRLVHIRATEIREGDRVIGSHGIGRDITEEREREEHMLLLTAALDQLPNGVSITDERRRLVYANSAYFRLLAAQPDTPARDVFAQAVDSESLLAAMDDGLREHGAWRGTFHRATDTDQTVPVEIVASNVVVDSQTLTFCVLRDLTEEVAREQQLRRAERLASVGTLVAGVAHELNNPLTAIAGFAELMLMEQHSDEDREMLKLTRREARRAARIVSDLRLIARETQRTAPASRGAVDLNDVVQHVLKLQSYALDTSNITVDLDLADDLPPVRGDVRDLEQVVINLVVNARQALDQARLSRPTISVRTRPAGDGAMLRIADNGPGIPPDHLERIFDPFFTTRSPGEGMGLGLSLVYRLVAEHEGQVDVQSSTGAGAAFTVSLPRAHTAPPAAERQVAGRASNLRILVVDDEEPIRRALLRFLNRRGHSVDVAGDGREALQLIEQRTYDIILSDLRMPGMGGELLLEALREHHPDAARRVMFMTGHVARDDATLAGEYPDVPVIEKPFSLNELGERLDELAARVRGGLDPEGA